MEVVLGLYWSSFPCKGDSLTLGRIEIKSNMTLIRGKSGRAGYRRYGVLSDAISVPADSASEIVKFTISIPRESCTNAKAKYSSSVVPPDPSVHFYHWLYSR